MAQVEISDTKSDQWDDFAKIYQRLTVQTSHGPIGALLKHANELLPFSDATAILDNGCGPGPIMSRLLDEYQIPETCSLTCADWSEGMIKQVQEKGKDNADSPWSRVEAVVQDATDLKDIKSGSKSHVTAGWVYFMTSNPAKCLTESKRVLKVGGVLSCSSWKGNQWLDLMNLIKAIRPDKILPEIPAGWREADTLKTEMEKAGFTDVQTFEVPTTLDFERMESLVDLCLYKMPHMQILTKDMSEEEMSKAKALMMEEGRKMCSEEPGALKGTALVAVGRK